MVAPVMYAAAGLERKTTAMAMSHLRPTRFSGIVSFIMASRCSAVPGSSFARPASMQSRARPCATEQQCHRVASSARGKTGVPVSASNRQARVRVASQVGFLQELSARVPDAHCIACLLSWSEVHAGLVSSAKVVGEKNCGTF